MDDGFDMPDRQVVGRVSPPREDSDVAPPAMRKVSSSARERWRERVAGWTKVTFLEWTIGVVVGGEQRSYRPGPARLPRGVAVELAERGFLELEDDDG